MARRTAVRAPGTCEPGQTAAAARCGRPAEPDRSVRDAGRDLLRARAAVPARRDHGCTGQAACRGGRPAPGHPMEGCRHDGTGSGDRRVARSEIAEPRRFTGGRRRYRPRRPRDVDRQRGLTGGRGAGIRRAGIRRAGIRRAGIRRAGRCRTGTSSRSWTGTTRRLAAGRDPGPGAGSGHPGCRTGRGAWPAGRTGWRLCPHAGLGRLPAAAESRRAGDRARRNLPVPLVPEAGRAVRPRPHGAVRPGRSHLCVQPRRSVPFASSAQAASSLDAAPAYVRNLQVDDASRAVLYLASRPLPQLSADLS